MEGVNINVICCGCENGDVLIFSSWDLSLVRKLHDHAQPSLSTPPLSTFTSYLNSPTLTQTTENDFEIGTLTRTVSYDGNQALEFNSSLVSGFHSLRNRKSVGTAFTSYLQNPNDIQSQSSPTLSTINQSTSPTMSPNLSASSVPTSSSNLNSSSNVNPTPSRDDSSATSSRLPSSQSPDSPIISISPSYNFIIFLFFLFFSFLFFKKRLK